MATFVDQDNWTWVSRDQRQVLWTKNLNECMVIIAFTDTHICFAHLNSNNYELNRNAKDHGEPGFRFQKELQNEPHGQVREFLVYTNPPDRTVIKSGTVRAVIRNFGMGDDTPFYALRWSANATFMFDTQTRASRRVWDQEAYESNMIDRGNEAGYSPIVAKGPNDNCCTLF
jgi:hypothetical protein